MNIVDALILLFLITSLMRGFELGLLRQTGIMAGTLLGLFAGIFVQSWLAHISMSSLMRALLALAIISTLMFLFAAIGDRLMQLVKMQLQRAKPLRILDILDKIGGLVISFITLLIVVWLLAGVFVNIRIGNVQSYIRNSLIIRELNKRLPPTPDFAGRLGKLIDPNNFPTVFVGFEPSIQTNTPLPSIGALDPAVQATRASVVKVEGEGCGNISAGSGFVVDNDLVITNAHVIAGVSDPIILDANGRHTATPIWFDPNLDLAILRARNLKGSPLAMQSDFAAKNTQTAALGYPGGQSFVAQPAVILDTFEAVGQNIYNQGQTKRSVYAFKGDVEPGNSGGPLIDQQGKVLGVVFAKSASYDVTGYALTANQAISSLNQAELRNQVVGTGTCRE